MTSPGSVWLARLSLISAAMLWSTSFVVLKASLAVYHPHVIIFGRMLVASICFVPLFWKYRRAWRLRPGSVKLILFMAFCEPCLYFLAETAALQRTTAAQAGMITAMLPLMVALGAYIVLKEEISTPMVLGFAMAIAGAVWLSLSSRVEQSAPNPVLGNFLEFLAMVCASGYMISVRRLTTTYRYSPLFITAAQAVLGMVFYLPLLMMPGVDLAAHLELNYLWAVFYLGAFISMGAYGFYNFGISRIPAGQGALFINLIPVFSVFFAWLFLKERFTTSQYLAAALILAGIYISHRRTRASRQ